MHLCSNELYTQILSKLTPNVEYNFTQNFTKKKSASMI
jgi:hypothetical protein